MHNPNKNVLIMSIKEKIFALYPMRRGKKKGESVCSCTRTGKKKRLRRQSGLKEEQKKKKLRSISIHAKKESFISSLLFKPSFRFVFRT